MQNLVWTITVRRKGEEYGLSDQYITGKVKYFLSESTNPTIKIGNSANMDIWVTQSFPFHAALKIVDKEFVIQANKKLILQYQDKTQILTKGEMFSAPLENFSDSEEKITCFIKIKDTLIKSVLKPDENLLKPESTAYQYLTQKYGRLEKIAQGENALLYRNLQGKPLIFKILKVDKQDAQSIQKFLQTASMLERFKSSLLPPVLEIIKESRICLYGYIMEGTPLESLKNKIIKQKRLDGKTFTKFLNQLGQFLYDLHSQNILYKDLSPENILLDDEGNCHLAGLSFLRYSNASSKEDLQGMPVYPAFTAPEQIENPFVADMRCDIFSFACILYYTLAGKPPFEAQNSMEYLRAIKQGLPLPEFPANNQLAESYKKLISSSLSLALDQRPSSLQDFWEEFQKTGRENNLEIPSLMASNSRYIEDHPEDHQEENISKPSTDKPQNGKEEKYLGKFLLESEIGRGAVGVVYRAFDTKLKRHVALKVLTYSQIANQDQIERFLEEAKSASSLDHPNIITIYEVGKEGEYHYIAMQLIEGMNLQQYQQKNPLAIRQALVLVRDIAYALHHAHTRNIIHRDVKPSNIMIDRYEKPYLMDFGLAKNTKSEHHLTKSGEVVGTLVYMSPEVLQGYQPSALQDIYSLGAILYELLTGQSLVEGLSSVEILSKIMNVEPAIRKIKPKLASDAEAICLKALEKNPLRRYQTAKAFAQDIDCFLDYKPVQAKKPGFLYRIYKKALRHQGIVAVSTISFLLLVTLSFYSFVVYPAAEKDKALFEIRNKALEIYKEFQTNHRNALDAIPTTIDTEGISEESKEIEKDAIAKMRKMQIEKYRNAIAAEVLPLYRQALQMGQKEEDKKNLLHLLQLLINLTESEVERRPFRIESLQIQKKDTKALDEYAPVLIKTDPIFTHVYLYRFVDTQDGRKRLVPVDAKTGDLLALNQQKKQKLESLENFLRCQNLLWEAVFQMLNLNYFVAQNSLIRSLEIHPEYIDAYMLLCCLQILNRDHEISKTLDKERAIKKQLEQIFKDLENRKKERQDFFLKDMEDKRKECDEIIKILEEQKKECEESLKVLIRNKKQIEEQAAKDTEKWINRVIKMVQTSRLSQDDKKRLLSYFTNTFLGRASSIYSLLPHRSFQGKVDYLVKLTSLPSQNTPLQKGDCFLKIDESNILSEESLKQALSKKKSVSCTVWRNWELHQFTLDASVYSDPYFQVIEDAPVFWIWDNRPLHFLRNSVYDLVEEEKCKVSDNKTLLDIGDYMLYCKAPGYFTIRFPFKVFREQSFGKPFAYPIYLHLPSYPKDWDKEKYDFVIVPRGFVAGETRHQNTTGYIMSRYETTIGDWLEYLKSVHGPLPWQKEKIAKRIPLILPDRPLFHFRDGEITLRIGEPSWPVFGVSHEQIQEYIQWYNERLPESIKEMGVKFRLPTVEEWQAAARGADQREYPWGNYPNPKFAKILGARIYQAYQEPIAREMPAFICDESPFGINDMGGSVSEFTCTEKYGGTNTLFAVKGSGWSDSRLANISTVWHSSSLVRQVSRGFRLCAGLDPLYGISYKKP
ncbi:MAG: protein kinase [Candidatus Brocadiae bacterium]|nr:protein kinase [Candidatus Brocadiia bacterium]